MKPRITILAVIVAIVAVAIGLTTLANFRLSNTTITTTVNQTQTTTTTVTTTVFGLPIPFEVIGTSPINDITGGSMERDFMIIDNEEAYSNIYSYPMPHPVDFESDFMIVVTSGPRGTTGYRISIEEILLEGTQVKILVNETNPVTVIDHTTYTQLQVITYPWQVVGVSRDQVPNGTLTFTFMDMKGKILSVKTHTFKSQPVYLSEEKDSWRREARISSTVARNGDMIEFNLTLTNISPETQMIETSGTTGRNCNWYSVDIYNSSNNLVYRNPWAIMAMVCHKNFEPNQSETVIISWEVGKLYAYEWPHPIPPGKYAIMIITKVLITEIARFPPVELNIVE